MITQTIPKRNNHCKTCGRKFQADEECYTSLIHGDEEWIREDTCKACEENKGEAYWRTKIPQDEVKPIHSAESLWELFQEKFEARTFAEAYLLAHMLVRQKQLDVKREPYFQNEQRGALFIHPETEVNYFIPTAFTEGALDRARQELKQIMAAINAS
jgi:hypothetical protein